MVFCKSDEGNPDWSAADFGNSGAMGVGVRNWLGEGMRRLAVDGAPIPR